METAQAIGYIAGVVVMVAFLVAGWKRVRLVLIALIVALLTGLVAVSTSGTVALLTALPWLLLYGVGRGAAALFDKRKPLDR